MDTLITIALFILVLGVLVLVHEIGHFFAARFFKVAVDEFGIGFPPRLWMKKIGNTEYSLNAIPVGGFVRVKGVAGDERLQEKASSDPDSFSVQKFWKRFLILFAGIGMNVVLGACFFIVMFWAGIRIPIDVDQAASNRELSVSYILSEGPAALSGMRIGDAIVSVDGATVATVEDFRSIIQQKEGEPVAIVIQRNAQEQTLIVTPQQVEVEGDTVVGVGVGMLNTGIVRYGFFEGILAGVKTTAATMLAIVTGLIDLAKNLIFRDAPVSASLSGPVGIAVMTREFAQAGIASLLQFCAILSLNLAIFNLLPFPMLDGGRIFFLAIELFRGKPVSHQFEARVHQIGFILLFGLLIFVTAQDIVHLF